MVMGKWLPSQRPGTPSGLLPHSLPPRIPTNTPTCHSLVSPPIHSCCASLIRPQYTSTVVLKNFYGFLCIQTPAQVSTPLLLALEWLPIALRVKTKLLVRWFVHILYFVSPASRPSFFLSPSSLCFHSSQEDRVLLIIFDFSLPHPVADPSIYSPPSKYMQNGTLSQ